MLRPTYRSQELGLEAGVDLVAVGPGGGGSGPGRGRVGGRAPPGRGLKRFNRSTIDSMDYYTRWFNRKDILPPHLRRRGRRRPRRGRRRRRGVGLDVDHALPLAADA